MSARELFAALLDTDNTIRSGAEVSHDNYPRFAASKCFFFVFVSKTYFRSQLMKIDLTNFFVVIFLLINEFIWISTFFLYTKHDFKIGSSSVPRFVQDLFNF